MTPRSRKTLLVCAACAAGAVVTGLAWYRPGSSEVEATVSAKTLVSNVIPFGINLGSWTFWGAEQLSSNIIKNPGFEGTIDGAIVLPVHSGDNNFDDNPAWLARPQAFWEGATYSIRTGTNAGREGAIIHSSPKNVFGLPDFTARPGDPVPGPGEAASLVRDREDAVPTQWWFSKDTANSFSPESSQRRPGSPGVRSLRVSAGSYNHAEVASYVDAIGDRAGKLLPLSGAWKLSFWVRLDRGNASLRVVVGREGSRPVLAQAVPVAAAWKHVEFAFEAEDGGPPGLISLRFQITGQPAGDLLLDDVDLRRVKDSRLEFREEVVSMLQRLHPSYLRDWQGQLGDTLANRIAPPFGRKAWRYRPGGDDQTDFGYGLGDFLDLAARINAAPWIIVPPVFTDSECSGLGDYLSAPARLPKNQEILVEFGNENWNELFRPAGISDPVIHAQAADRCFTAIRQHAPGLNLKTVINAQFANPERVAAFAHETRMADIVAVAPYFALSMDKGQSLPDRNAALFVSRRDTMEQIASSIAPLRKELAVYEVNLHTVNGDATPAERMPVVAGVAAGAALAKTMLDSLSTGMRRQCVYSFTGFDASLPTTKGYAPLWGIARDLGATPRFRPTGLALELLNQVIGGDMREVRQRGPDDVSVYAFALREGISVIAVSGSQVRRHVSVHYPGPKPRLLRLAATSASATNENFEEVKLRAGEVVFNNGIASFDLEPWSISVIKPQ